MSIPGSAAPFLLARQEQYRIERSLRFNASDSAYLSRTPASAGNRKTWTWAGWVKKARTGQLETLFGAWNGGGADLDYFRFIFNGNVIQAGGGGVTYFYTNEVYRDPSAWYHIVLVLNTPSSVANERFRLYVNGAEISSFAARNNPTQNTDFVINTTSAHNIGRSPDNTGYLSGYLADIHFIDGQALDPTSFGEFDTNGVWQPKAYTGTYGTNGFHLPFSDNSTAAALGTDTSGNGNDWTVNNIAVGGAQPALYSSPNLYTDAADVIANGTPLSSGSTFSNVYVYLVTNGGGDIGSKVFTADGSGTIGTIWTWLHRIGASWTFSGNYNDTEWDLFTWGSQTVATNYVMNNSAPLHMLVSSGGFPQQVSGTIATFNSAPNSGANNDSLVDTPTSYGTDTGTGGEVRGNYATLNPLQFSTIGLSQGNLEGVGISAAWRHVASTIGVSSGKWYWEFTTITGAENTVGFGLAVSGDNPLSFPTHYVIYAGSVVGPGANGTVSGWANGDIHGFAFDADAGRLDIYKNGILETGYYSGLTSGPYFPAIIVYGPYQSTVGRMDANFGQRPFAFSAPPGFKALCTTNLP